MLTKKAMLSIILIFSIILSFPINDNNISPQKIAEICESEDLSLIRESLKYNDRILNFFIYNTLYNAGEDYAEYILDSLIREESEFFTIRNMVASTDISCIIRVFLDDYPTNFFNAFKERNEITNRRLMEYLFIVNNTENETSIDQNWAHMIEILKLKPSVYFDVINKTRNTKNKYMNKYLLKVLHFRVHLDPVNMIVRKYADDFLTDLEKETILYTEPKHLDPHRD